jgi:hypothetical protein
MSIRLSKCVLPLFLLFAVAGCGESGPKTYPVTGTASYQGKPLPLGTVMFVSDHGPAASSTIDADGKYRLDAVPGKHRVAIIAMPPQQGRPDPNVEGGIDTTGFPPAKSLVPQKYNDYNTSGVEVEVKSDGANKIDINLP